MEQIVGTLFSFEGLFTLCMLLMLQMVLGFDNLLYISIESKRVVEDKRAMVRRIGIGLAILLRIILLFVIIKLVAALKETLFDFDLFGFAKGSVSGHALIVLLGGAFIIYTAIKEITHLLVVKDLANEGAGHTRSVASSIALIVLMNLVFSFDSILSAMALTESFVIMALAIIISGGMMIWLADHVAEFIEKNRMYEVLGLFILFIVGVLLVSEGGELANVELLGHPVQAMAKSTFYFVLFVLVVVDVVQSKYQKRLLKAEYQKT